MKHILTTLLLLFSLTLSAQTTVVTGPKKKQQTAAPAKPKPATPAAKPQPKQTSKPQQPKANTKSQPKQTSISTPTGYENGYGYVDLGLSVKWAICNVGASSPTDYGGYYAWGETRTKSTYSWDTYFDSVNGSYSNFNKYATNKKTILDLSDDAAYANWGGSWRMPTRAEQDELREKCTWTWTTQSGVKGYKVSSKRNGNSIFLPAAGFRNGGGLSYAGSRGFYWSSSLYSDNSSDACFLNFYSDLVNWSYIFRYNGLSVRAVCP